MKNWFQMLTAFDLWIFFYMIRVFLEFKVGWFIMSCSKETLSLLTIWISRRVHSRFLAGSVFLISLVFCVVLHFYLLFIFGLCLLNSILSVSLDCPFLIIPLVFSNLYLLSADVIIYCLASNHIFSRKWQNIRICTSWGCWAASDLMILPSAYLGKRLSNQWNALIIGAFVG